MWFAQWTRLAVDNSVSSWFNNDVLYNVCISPDEDMIDCLEIEFTNSEECAAFRLLLNTISVIVLPKITDEYIPRKLLGQGA